MVTFAIGDVHGYRATLDDLLAAMLPDVRPGDEIVFLGDVIDGGPDGRGVVDRILALSAEHAGPVTTLRGNHEDWLGRTLADPTRHSWFLGMDGTSTIASYSPAAARAIGEAARAAGASLLKGGVALPYDLFFEAMPAAHRSFFASLPRSRRTPDALCVHAGVPGPDGDPDAYVNGRAGFPEDYDGRSIVVYGHRGDAVDDGGQAAPRWTGRAVGIDAILATGVLLAMRFPDRRVYRSRTPIDGETP